MCFKYFTRTTIILNLFSIVSPGENTWYNIKYNVMSFSINGIFIKLMDFLPNYVIFIPTN